jgi:hypothetical protein
MTTLPPPPPSRDEPRDRVRPSRTVDLAAYPVVQARRALDRRLDQFCGLAEDEVPAVRPADLDLLQRITRERFDDTDERRESAVDALGVLAARGSPEAVARLVALAVNPLEDEGVRLGAIARLPQVAWRPLRARLTTDPSPVVRDYARRRAGR